VALMPGATLVKRRSLFSEPIEIVFGWSASE
jgi:hypothetical protein